MNQNEGVLCQRCSWAGQAGSAGSGCSAQQGQASHAQRADLRCSADRRAAGRARQYAPQQLVGAVVQRVGGQHARQHGGEAAVQPGRALCCQRLPRSAGRVCFTGLQSVAVWAV